MNDCSCPREKITAWLDGELADPQEVVALEGHLAGCETCRTYAEAEAATKTLVASTYQAPVDVSGLRTRIRAGLEAARAAKRRRWTVAVPRLAWAGAAVAVALVGLALGFLTLEPRTPVEASPLVRAAVTDHMRCMMGGLPFEVTTTDQPEVDRWLRRRLGRPVALPALASEGEISTRPARLVTTEGAQVFFDRRGLMLSLFIMPATVEPQRLGELVHRGEREFFVTRFQGFTVVFWGQGDLLYCLVSADDEAEVLSVAVEYARGTG